MKSVKTKEVKNWTLPGAKITHKEFLAGIREAEKGPFMTIEEFKKRFYKWRKEKVTTHPLS